MTRWEWFAGIVGDECYALACGCATREAALTEALREAGPDDEIQLIEARSSEAAEHESADVVPFLRTRNHEIIGTRGDWLRRAVA